ncbi:Ferric iron reductase FhuF-like transporter [Pseudomonas sp. ok272]|uniref:ferric iron reductase n=1 Tax=unclassified Pseudomonas TaxID=196821 RepID=UPI0008B41DF4|nr:MULTISPECIES: ferric iron reductase [unclassified Pseudomonas]SEN38086.1 Ferric iron reductase FhuF-like transporter [Pseudomonas sp. ok272]SFN22284.1 Ferric iron reductase FhuF-like transporter [Pseudomonas sp. ok602]
MHTDLHQQQHPPCQRNDAPTHLDPKRHPFEPAALLLHLLEREPQLGRVLGIAAQPGELAVPVDSLFALDPHGQPRLRQWVALAQGVDDAPALLRFIHDYLAIVVPGLLGMYLLYGVAFQPHRQHSLMAINADGQPGRLLLQGFAGIHIHHSTLRWQGVAPPFPAPRSDPAERVRDTFIHTTLMCHLGELVWLCARHWPVHEYALWRELARHLDDCFEHLRERVEPQRWRLERQALLERDWPTQSPGICRQHNPLKMRR